MVIKAVLGPRGSPAVNRTSVRSPAFLSSPGLSTRSLGVLFDSPLKKYLHCAITIAWPGEKTETQRTQFQGHWNLRDLSFYTYKLRLVWILWQELVYKISGFHVAPDVL